MKRARSFKVLLATLATLVPGGILLLFGLLSWQLVHWQFLASVDARLMVPFQQALQHLRPDMDWERFLDRRFPEWKETFPESRLFLVLNENGELVYATERSAWLLAEDLSSRIPPSRRESGRSLPPGGPGPDHRLKPPHTRPVFETITSPNGERWRVVVARNPRRVLFMGVSLRALENELEVARWIFILAIPTAILATAIGGWLVAERALRPVGRMTTIASQVSAAGLSARIPQTGEEYAEFARLIEIFNHMMERLERNFHQAQRFTADASHELKTPIALLQADVDTALKQAPPDSREAEVLSGMAEEIARLKRIISSLLLLSQSDAGRMKLNREPFDFGEALDGLLEDAHELCIEAGLRLNAAVLPGTTLEGDKVLLVQAVQNLLMNAIKYNRQDGEVTLWVARKEDGTVFVEVGNTGSGIPEEDRAKIFDRFYRADQSRGRKLDGFGLGLNLALEIVREHGGKLELVKSEPDQTLFRITLPPHDLWEKGKRPKSVF